MNRHFTATIQLICCATLGCVVGGWSTTAAAGEPAVSIDATHIGAPVSKYIYGQFIEHLGRCIYGGIWAEMLLDRKFYYPITPEYNPYRATRAIPKGAPLPVVGASPWQIIGAGDSRNGASVKMVADDSFVGEHTPLVAPGCGIRQRDLGLVQGKQYVGYVWLKPTAGAGRVDISLRWGEGSQHADQTTLRVAAEDYRKYPFRFQAGATTDQGMLEIRLAEGSPCLIGTASLMPADHVQGMRADTLALLKELDSPVYRWPGGNFVSGYDWKDGIGQRDRRPPRKNPAWTGVEHNDFGIDEFVTFCRWLNAEPYIAVNSGLGGVENAVDELEYANGGADSPMGRLRAENGHAQPYGVKWWGIGNEMYGRWQLGHVPLEEYVKKHNLFAQAFRRKDPSIALVAVGAAGPWSEGMMTHCADQMDLISEHFYCKQVPGLIAHVRQIPDRIRQKAAAHRTYRRQLDSLAGKDIRIALDEWNYWYGPQLFGELGARYFLQDALGIAAGLNEYVRQSDLFFMANYAQTVNVIGCIKTTKTQASFAPTGLTLKLYRRHFGVLPVAATADEPLDVAAALTEDKKTLTVAIVNPTLRKLELPLKLSGLELNGTGRRWQIAGDDPMAYNEPGQTPNVSIEEAAVSDLSGKLAVEPCSVTLYALVVK